MRTGVFAILAAGLLVAADAPPEEAKAIEQALKSLNAAFVKHDVDAIKRLTGDDLVVVGTSGQRQTRDEQLKSLPDLKLTEYTIADLKISCPTKETAIVTFSGAVKGTFAGKALPEKVTVSTVWALRDGKWVEVFYQATPAAGK